MIQPIALCDSGMWEEVNSLLREMGTHNLPLQVSVYVCISTLSPILSTQYQPYHATIH